MLSGGPNKAGGQVGRKTAKYKKNRRAVAMATPARPFYTVPTIFGVGSSPGSGTGPGNEVTVNFDMQVSVYSQIATTQCGWVDASQSPNLTVLNVIQLSPTQVVLIFSGLVQAGDAIKVPSDDPVIRTYHGGYVQAGDYTAP
jgi:hypothetical protein